MSHPFATVHSTEDRLVITVIGLVFLLAVIGAVMSFMRQ